MLMTAMAKRAPEPIPAGIVAPPVCDSARASDHHRTRRFIAAL